MAEHVPPAFARLQTLGVLPNPWHARGHVRLGEGRPGYSELLVAEYKPEEPLAPYVTVSDDEDSAEYLELFRAFDRETAKPWRYGVFDVPDVKLMPAFGVHSSPAGSFVDIYCNITALANPKYEVPRWSLLLARPAERYEAGVFLGVTWYHNHYHWLIDILPRLTLVSHHLADGLPVIAPPGLRPLQMAALRAVLDSMGHRAVRIVQPEGRVVQFQRLVMPTQMATPLDMTPAQVGLLRSAFLDNTAAADTPRRIYISRKDAKIRRVANEDELWCDLRRLGFVSVELARLPFAQQIALFRGAECVVGHHGAGFTNLAFSSRGAAFVELFQQGHFSPGFARLAQLNRLRYGFTVGQAFGVDTVVDVRRVNALLDRLGVM